MIAFAGGSLSARLSRMRVLIVPSRTSWYRFPRDEEGGNARCKAQHSRTVEQTQIPKPV